MTSRSLAFRLFAAAALWVIVVLLVAGVILASYYRQASEAGFDERLHVYLKALVADLANADTLNTAQIGGLGEPRFEIPLSGWYWQVRSVDKPSNSIGSKSLFESSLPDLADLGAEAQPGGVRTSYITGPDARPLRAVERTIELGRDGRYLITVAAPAGDIEAAIAQFRSALILSFVLLGVGLVATTFLQVRYGLRPINDMRVTLAAIRAGRAERMPPNLPDEIEPLARELDALIDGNKQIVERARTHVGNLAHALKTPLSVITNEAEATRGAFAEKVTAQARVMRDQIDHHLQRARIAAAVSIVGTVTDARSVIEALVRTMEKIHRDKQFVLTVGGGDALRFRGEKQDLEEILGNLVDNAGKWATSDVDIAVRLQSIDSRVVIAVTIDDDGPGVPAEQLPTLGQRGKRLDESVPGSGLGLAIVSDLVALYGGTLAFTASPKGGLRVAVTLPGVA
jgi:signal transduction histidine kinase